MLIAITTFVATETIYEVSADTNNISTIKSSKKVSEKEMLSKEEITYKKNQDQPIRLIYSLN